MRYIRTSGTEAYDAEKLAKVKFGEDNFFLVDKNYNKCDGNIISIYEFKDKYNGRDIVIIPSKYLSEEEIELWKVIGIDESNVYVFHDNKIVEYTVFTYLEYLEFHVNDHCNLNCSGCSHFCPLVKTEEFTDPNVFMRDIHRLKELIEYIGIIRIMGGEPLLNKDLDLFVRECRFTYPLSDIRVVTNGILLTSLSQKVWQSFRDNNIKVDISVYPPLYKSITSNLETIRENNVGVGSIRNVYSFEKILHKRNRRFFNNTNECICNNLHDGYIATCQLAFYGEYYNRYYDKRIPFEDGKIDLYSIEDGKELMRRLNEPFEACNYCEQFHFSVNSEKIPWKACDNKKNTVVDDWWIEG